MILRKQPHSKTDTRTNSRRLLIQRVKSCPLSKPNSPRIDYKNLRLLKKYLSERYKILPSRITSVSAKKQRQLAQAIKRARFLALFPYHAL